MTDAPAPEPEEWPLVSVIMPTRGRPQLVRELLSAARARIGHQHRLPPAMRQRTSDVACADEADLHAPNVTRRGS